MAHTILIVDDSSLFRDSLRSCISQSGRWRVCGEAGDGKVAVEKVKELQPDIVILDLQMPVMNGLEAARQISRIAPKTVMVMFTIQDHERLLKDARAAGIQNVFSKYDGVADHLFAFLNEVCTEH